MDDRCPECGGALDGAGLCPGCGWDPVLAHRRSRRIRPLAVIPRLLLWGGLAVLLGLAAWRWVLFGPGPDLRTTLEWLASGDGGRAATLVTLHRANEIAAAGARWAVRHLEAPSFEGDWAARLAPLSTMAVRGWLPLLFSAADARLAPGPVKEFYEVRSTDGWGRPYRVRTRALPRGFDAAADPEVAADLAAGLNTTFFAAGRPEFDRRGYLRLELLSAGADGRFETDDDILFVAYLPVELTFRVGMDRTAIQRRMEAAYLTGRHLHRFSGTPWDLVDARLLAEHRLDTLMLAGGS